jgi:hypothetical protein
VLNKPINCSKRIPLSSWITEDVVPNYVAVHLFCVSEMRTGLQDKTFTSGLEGNENVGFPSIFAVLQHTYVFHSHEKYT